MTENSRLATAAAAMVQRMIMRRSVLVFLPVPPWRKGSIGVVTAMLMRRRTKDSLRVDDVFLYQKMQSSRCSLVTGLGARGAHPWSRDKTGKT